MYEGTLIYTFTGDTNKGESTHGSAGMVYWGFIPEEDRKLLAKSARIKLGTEMVAPPSSLFVTPKEIKDNSFDIKFYGPNGEQSSFDGSGIFAASRAAQKKFNIADGSTITFVPDPKFGFCAAPEKAHVKVDVGVDGPTASFMMKPAGISPLSIDDPSYTILSSYIPDIMENVYKTSLGDIIYLAKNAESLRQNPVTTKLLEDLIKIDPTMYGVVGVAQTEKSNYFEMQLSSPVYGGAEAGCVTTSAEVVPFLETIGLLKKSGKDFSSSINLSSPYKVVDGKELGSKMTVQRIPYSGSIFSIMNVSDGGVFYFDRQDNGALKQYSFAELAFSHSRFR